MAAHPHPDMADLRKIYRSFDFGQLLSLHMLETRLLARDKPIEVNDLLNPATATVTRSELASPPARCWATNS
ncbi:MAG: alkaline phosphatase D family protein [Burkholderiales bacterium]|nr:alkaline phosphatase D family protein [Burkholderiales bacterium]